MEWKAQETVVVGLSTRSDERDPSLKTRGGGGGGGGRGVFSWTKIGMLLRDKRCFLRR